MLGNTFSPPLQFTLHFTALHTVFFMLLFHSLFHFLFCMDIYMGKQKTPQQQSTNIKPECHKDRLVQYLKLFQHCFPECLRFQVTPWLSTSSLNFETSTKYSVSSLHKHQIKHVWNVRELSSTP